MAGTSRGRGVRWPEAAFGPRWRSRTAALTSPSACNTPGTLRPGPDGEHQRRFTRGAPWGDGPGNVGSMVRHCCPPASTPASAATAARARSGPTTWHCGIPPPAGPPASRPIASQPGRDLSTRRTRLTAIPARPAAPIHNQADMAPAARASQRPRTERTARCSAARAGRKQVNTPPGERVRRAMTRERQRQNGVPEISSKPD
jgi:hypothetical protein